MYIKFESITIRNIGSFGNKKTTFKYENGFHLVSASNGSGKCVSGDTKVNIIPSDSKTQELLETFLKNKAVHCINNPKEILGDNGSEQNLYKSNGDC